MSIPNTPAEAGGKVASGAKAGGKSLVKSLKGHPPWMYAVIVVGALAVAYMVRQRQNAAAAMASSPDDTSTPYGSYDTSAYPGATQGAGNSYGQGDPPPADNGGMVNLPGYLTPEQVGQIISLLPGIGGGMPNLPDDAHRVPTVDVQGPSGGGAIEPWPAPSQAVAQPPAPAPHLNPAGSSGPQPTLGPGIFYNSDRKLRYIIQNQKTTTYPRGHNFRRYESRLNKGDWGSGGVIPQ